MPEGTYISAICTLIAILLGWLCIEVRSLRAKMDSKADKDDFNRLESKVVFKDTCKARHGEAEA